MSGKSDLLKSSNEEINFDYEEFLKVFTFEKNLKTNFKEDFTKKVVKLK